MAAGIPALIRSPPVMRTFPKSEFTCLRERAGLTRAEAAALVEVSERTAYRYENGETAPPKLALRTLREAAKARCAKKAAGFRFKRPAVRALRRGDESAARSVIRCSFTGGGDC